MEIDKEMEEKIRQDALDKLELGLTVHGMNIYDILIYLLVDFAKEILKEYAKDVVEAGGVEPPSGKANSD